MMMSNATGGSSSSSSWTAWPLARQALVGCALSLLIVWTFLGNLTVCAAVFRYRHLQAKVTNVFVVSLALSDLLVATLVMPWKAAAEVVGSWPFGALCDTWVACDIMCSTASILHLCLISVDRYWAISSPFRYERSMSRRLACVVIGVTWTVSVVISFVPVQLNWHRAAAAEEVVVMGDRGSGNDTDGGDVAGGGNCDSSLNRTYAISSSLISFYIPVAVMIVTYTRIYRIAHMQIRRISSLERAADHARSCRSDAAENFSRPRSRSLSAAAAAAAGAAFGATKHQHQHPHPYPYQRALRVSIGKETKVLKTLSVIVGVFVCCWTPFFVLNCALPFCPSGGGDGGGGGTTHLSPRDRQHLPYCVSKRTFDVFVWIGWSNSSLNPIIYAFNADFRDAFLRLLGCRVVGECWGAAAADAVETADAAPAAAASNEAASEPKRDGSLYVSYRTDARGSNDSGNTTVTVFCDRVARDLVTSDQAADTVEKMDDNAVKLIHIPR
ncbi:unnamed protein product [Merluccius merluccius]